MTLGVLALALGCSQPVPDPSHIDEDSFLAMKIEVRELGPVEVEARSEFENPAPFTEAMPGDTLRFEAVVVGSDGLPLEPEELELMWFQCGRYLCTVDHDRLAADMERPCASLGADDDSEAYSYSSQCLVGSGAGWVEGQLPPLSPENGGFPSAVHYYGVVAWPGRSAADCWERRRERDADFEGCAFIQRELRLGPQWLMIRHALELGLEAPWTLEEIPEPLFYQVPNQAPIIAAVRAEVDGVLVRSGPIETAWAEPLVVEPGAEIDVEVELDPVAQLFQSYFIAKAAGDDPPVTYFTLEPEVAFFRMFTSGDLSVLEFISPEHRIVTVDPLADPGISRLLIKATDRRGSEDLRWIAFEVR